MIGIWIAVSIIAFAALAWHWWLGLIIALLGGILLGLGIYK